MPQFIGKGGGISGQLKGLHRHHGRSRVMTVCPASIGREPCHNCIGAKLSNYAHHIGQNFLSIPDREGFLRTLRIAKVIGPRKELSPSIDPTRRQ